MARSKLSTVVSDLLSDGGNVLFSFVKGEQLEYPIDLNFIADAGNGYIYEAVVVEGDNTAGQTTPPVDIKANGTQTKLTVRIPTYMGAWAGATLYNAGQVVVYNSIYYTLLFGVSRSSSVPPPSDPLWQVTTLSRLYVQFPLTLGATWLNNPTVGSNVYGFFELRVTEASAASFPKTWKPVRGMVELVFSPTDVVPG